MESKNISFNIPAKDPEICVDSERVEYSFIFDDEGVSSGMTIKSQLKKNHYKTLQAGNKLPYSIDYGPGEPKIFGMGSLDKDLFLFMEVYKL